MRSSYFVLALAAVSAAGCKAIDTTTPFVPAPTYHVQATVTGNGACAVKTLDSNYSSIGHISGDVPSKFVSTFNAGYHGTSCWVSTDGGNTRSGDDGFINIIFSGNTFGKALQVGTYGLRLEILDDTPPMMATIRFHPASLLNDELRPLDNAVGSIVVDSTASGVRTIHVDLQATRWHYGF